jgi:hypothetical protein
MLRDAVAQAEGGAPGRGLGDVEVGPGDEDVLHEGPLRVGDLARGVVVLDVAVDEGIEGVLVAQVLEEALLSPALEHAKATWGADRSPTTQPAPWSHRTCS